MLCWRLRTYQVQCVVLNDSELDTAPIAKLSPSNVPLGTPNAVALRLHTLESNTLALGESAFGASIGIFGPFIKATMRFFWLIPSHIWSMVDLTSKLAAS